MSHVPQMSDQGGGVPLRKIERLFSYMYSTAPTPQLGTGGTPLVRWLHSGSPHWPPEECLLVFWSPYQIVTLAHLSLPYLPWSLRPCVAVCESASGPPCSSCLSPACTYLPICGCLSVTVPQLSLPLSLSTSNYLSLGVVQLTNTSLSIASRVGGAGCGKLRQSGAP